MNNPNLPEQGKPHRFSSANQPARRGRLPSKLKKYVKDNGVSKSDLDMIFKNIIFGKTLNELQEMLEPESRGDLPVIVVGLITSCVHDIQHGTMKEINNHIDRIWGNPKQTLALEEPLQRDDFLDRIDRALDAAYDGQ